MAAPLKIKNKRVRLHKAVVQPDFTQMNVLTNQPWTFVDLWLRRNKHERAAEYWEQARHFYKAAQGLPLQSAPLLLYYSFLNATKALLITKGIEIPNHHGLSESKKNEEVVRKSLSNISVKIRGYGAAPSLIAYFENKELRREISLQELFYNLPFIHRTYSLTYQSSSEMFIPIKNCIFERNEKTRSVIFTADIGQSVDIKKIQKNLPEHFHLVKGENGAWKLHSKEQIEWKYTRRAAKGEVEKLRELHRSIREHIVYINGVETLWYLKTLRKSNLALSSASIMFIAMHRLSEICRYKTDEMLKFIKSKDNWLLSEFIEMAPNQFFDEIASEITGYQFLVPSFRPTK